MVYNNCALYMLLYKQQCRGFYYHRLYSSREVCVLGTPSSCTAIGKGRNYCRSILVSCPDPASQSPKKGGLVSIDAFLGPNTFRDLKIGITNQITEQPINRACDMSRVRLIWRLLYRALELVPELETSTVDTAIASAFSVVGYDKPIYASAGRVHQGVCVGTGSGKSLCFLALPLVYDCLGLSTRTEHGSHMCPAPRMGTSITNDSKKAITFCNTVLFGTCIQASSITAQRNGTIALGVAV